MSADIAPPPLAPRVIHAGQGQPIVLASDGKTRVLTGHQPDRLLADIAVELLTQPGPAIDLGPSISVEPVPRLAALRLVADLAAAIASNLEASRRRAESGQPPRHQDTKEGQQE